MSTLDFRATSNPQNIVAELNLSYRLESTSTSKHRQNGGSACKGVRRCCQPSGAAGFLLEPGRILHDASSGNDPIWVWTND